MSEVPVQVIIAAFDDEKAADETLKELKAARWAGLIGIQNAAVLRRDQKNKLHVKELKDWGGGKGAAVGGTIGAVIGMITGPGAILTGAVGAAIGGLAAKLRDSGFSNERLNTLGESLKPGSSAVLAIIEHKWVAEMEKELAEAGADVITASIAADIAEQLQSGHEVAYTALETDEGTAVGRMAVGDDDMEVSRALFTEEGIVAGDAVITEEGFAGERVTVTDEGITYEVGAMTGEGAAYAGAVLTDEGAAVATITATPEEAEALEEGQAGEEDEAVEE
jgi:uncharacterized membrane protein